MAAFIAFLIMGILMIVSGILMLATPIMNFMSWGYFIIVLFFIAGIFGIVKAIRERRYGVEFCLAILALILGIVGLFVPGAAELNNSVLLFMAAGWFVIRGVLSIVLSIADRAKGSSFGMMLIGILLGVLDIVLGIYSFMHPAVMAISIGLLIAFYFIESGINLIFIGAELKDTLDDLKR